MAQPRKVNSLLTSRELQPLVNRAAKAATVQRAVRECLGPELGTHCTSATLRDGVLFVVTESNTWASRLRYSARVLARRLEAAPHGLKVDRIEVRVDPSLRRPEPRPPRRLHLSEENGQLLRQCADATADARLGAALRRLARHTDR